ncbi:hypothetical protein N7509_003881 [Penicillium cosmopolitanum]|uniref:BTB domain-containing protein n=1 Tax=Penicillium cosmopolitanum TaxID=1131564 RepID=A0A9W9W5V2_9EURO|nr:uncharacterized protein N7509_003881 [Penicillium cosmopolitanum]KAJ5404010.1 hypothetical protein N7509_003881 [Penicillium cosmopolitanum]
MTQHYWGPQRLRRILQSGVFHLYVGKKKKQITIHRALENAFPKKVLESTTIESVDEKLFGRCCEFVYSGDYSDPCPLPGSPGSNSSQSEDNETRCQEEAKGWEPSNLSWNVFHPKGLSLNYGIMQAELSHTPRSGSEGNLSNNPNTSYAAVFLGHADTHRFALRTDWYSLSVLSFYRLLRLLENFTLFEERTGDIVQLLIFVFEESESIKNLENMLRDYIIWNVKILMRNADFKRFLDRNSSLEQAVFRSMWN